ncbi:MAG: hypothetical protein RLZZ360_745 [Candidatus Parcubacteria bacterium]|jgi:hypothetical protein
METNTPVVKKPFYKKKWVWAVAVVLLIIIGSSGDSSQTTKTTSDTAEAEKVAVTEVALEVTATKLIADYKANEISADGMYKDKQVKVTGVVGSIAKDILDNPYVTLTDETQYGIESVQCYFSKADQANLANVTKDTRITLQGRVSGKSLTNVLVKECSISE